MNILRKTAGSLITLALCISMVIPASADETLFDMRGDDGVLMSLRPQGAAFISPDRLLVCDYADQQLHIFDLEGRRFRRIPVSRNLSAPNYTGIAALADQNFLVVGDHYHVNNVVRFVGAHSVIHKYELRGERFTDESARDNYDPNTALRRSGLLGEGLTNRMKIDGIAVDEVNGKAYLALSKPVEDDKSVIVFRTDLQNIMQRVRKFDVEYLDMGLVPETDATTETPYELTDICHVPNKGLLLLLSAKGADEHTFGSSQLWYKPDNATSAQLLLKDIAPGNFGAGLAATADGETYTAVITFDNNPELTSNASRLLVLPGLQL